MTEVPKKLIHELDRKHLSSSIEFEFLKMGRIAYDYLYDAIKKQRLSNRQAVNALHLLFTLTRERCYGLQNHLLQLVLELTSDTRIDVRTIATTIVIRLTLVNEAATNLEIPLGERHTVAPFIEKAIELGLKSSRDQSYAEDFLKGKF